MDPVALTIDYNNGAQKLFTRIPWHDGLTILGAIQAIQGIPPRATVKFGSDRVGHAIGLVIDGMPQEADKQLGWAVWVNERPFTTRLGTDTSFGFRPGERDVNLLSPGDHIVLRLSSPPS